MMRQMVALMQKASLHDKETKAKEKVKANNEYIRSFHEFVGIFSIARHYTEELYEMTIFVVENDDDEIPSCDVENECETSTCTLLVKIRETPRTVFKKDYPAKVYNATCVTLYDYGVLSFIVKFAAEAVEEEEKERSYTFSIINKKQITGHVSGKKIPIVGHKIKNEFAAMRT